MRPVKQTNKLPTMHVHKHKHTPQTHVFGLFGTKDLRRDE